MKNKIITIFGGSGFVGSYIVKELAKTGAYIQVVSRTPDRSTFLKIAGNVGQIYLQYVDVVDSTSISQVIENSDVVIDLVGILYEKSGSTFEAINKCAGVNIAKIAKKKQVKQFIYFSALNVNRAYESKYAQSKYRAEKEIQKEFSKAVIIRPSLIFGPEDRFFNFFANIISTFHIIPLIKDGYTKFQPVYVGDIAKAIAKIVNAESDYSGKVFEFAGAESYTFRELIKFISRTIDQKVLMVTIPNWIARFMAFFMEFLPRPILTRDQIKLLKYHNIVHKEDKLLYFSALGIKPKTVEQIVPAYLRSLKKT